MINNKNELYNEIDMLEGNINRMCSDDNLEDISFMYFHAIRRINNIFEFNLNRIKEKENLKL